MECLQFQTRDRTKVPNVTGGKDRGSFARRGSDEGIGNLQPVIPGVVFYQCHRQVTDRFVDRDYSEGVVLEKPADDSRFVPGPRALIEFHDVDYGNLSIRLLFQKLRRAGVASKEPDQYVRIKDHGSGSFAASLHRPGRRSCLFDPSKVRKRPQRAERLLSRKTGVRSWPLPSRDTTLPPFLRARRPSAHRWCGNVSRALSLSYVYFIVYTLLNNHAGPHRHRGRRNHRLVERLSSLETRCQSHRRRSVTTWCGRNRKVVRLDQRDFFEDSSQLL